MNYEQFKKQIAKPNPKFSGSDFTAHWSGADTMFTTSGQSEGCHQFVRDGYRYSYYFGPSQSKDYDQQILEYYGAPLLLEYLQYCHDCCLHPDAQTQWKDTIKWFKEHQKLRLYIPTRLAPAVRYQMICLFRYIWEAILIPPVAVYLRNSKVFSIFEIQIICSIYSRNHAHIEPGAAASAPPDVPALVPHYHQYPRLVDRLQHFHEYTNENQTTMGRVLMQGNGSFFSPSIMINAQMVFGANPHLKENVVEVMEVPERWRQVLETSETTNELSSSLYGDSGRAHFVNDLVELKAFAKKL